MQASGNGPPTAAARAILTQIGAPFRGWRRPILLGIFDLPGAGKTEVARWLAAHYPLVALSTDALRLRHSVQSGPDTIDAMYEFADALLPRHAAVIFDGIHLGKRDRDRLRAFAATHGADSALLYVTAERATIAARLAARENDAAKTALDEKFVITPAHFAQIASRLEPPDRTEAVWVIDTTRGATADHLTPFAR